MNLKDILKKVGGEILRNVVPGGGLILDSVNALLPPDNKLGDNSTGKDIEWAVNRMPADIQAQVMAQEFEVELANIKSWTTIQEAHAEADAAGSSTRPAIAMMMAWLVVLSGGVIIISFAYTIFMKDTVTTKALVDGWPFILAILATPTALLRAYFGMRTNEKKARYNTAAGHPVQGVVGALAGKLFGGGK